MNSLALKPLLAGYVPSIGNGVLEQQLLGGFARQRVQFVNNVHTVNASVSLHDEARQQYFWAFWRIHTLKPQPFLWGLMCDDYEIRTYMCQFVPESLQVGERSGKNYKVSFTVRCKPLNNNQFEIDEAIIALWETGDQVIDFLSEFEKLVNVSLPDALEDLEAWKAARMLEFANRLENLVNVNLPNALGKLNG